MKSARFSALATMIMLLCVSPVLAQKTFRQLIKDLQARYQSIENMRIRMTVSAYESRGVQSPLYHEKISLEKEGMAYRYRFAETDMMMNDKYVIVVNHSDHQIMISDRDLKKEIQFQKRVKFNMDSILQFYDDGTYEGVVNGFDKYSVPQKEGPIMKVELFVGQNSGNIGRINYAYRSGQWVTIEFDEFELIPVFEGNEFNEETFVRRTGKIWQASSALSRYTVVVSDEAR